MKSYKYIKIFVLMSIAILLQGCATLGHTYKEAHHIPEDKALVYLYRPSRFAGGGVSYYVYSNGKIVTKLLNGGYYPFIAEPGRIEIWAQTEAKDSINLNVESGEVYCVKGMVTMGIMMGRPDFHVMSPELARKEIEKCKFIPEKDWEVVKNEEEEKLTNVLSVE